MTFHNLARGGRTAYWFYLEGGVDEVLSQIEPGEVFFIQFGTNDSNTSATFTVEGTTYPRYADPDTDFRRYLIDYFIVPTRALGAIPVLVTPPPRNSGYCGGNSLGSHSAAMRAVGESEGVAVIDVNQATLEHLQALGCPAPTPESIFFVKADGSVDGTHFQENGARVLAGFVAEGTQEQALPLAAYLLE